YRKSHVHFNLLSRFCYQGRIRRIENQVEWLPLFNAFAYPVSEIPFSFLADPNRNRCELLSVDVFKDVSGRIDRHAVLDGSASIKNGYFLFSGHTFKKLRLMQDTHSTVKGIMLTINDKFSIKSFVRSNDSYDVQTVYEVRRVNDVGLVEYSGISRAVDLPPHAVGDLQDDVVNCRKLIANRNQVS